MKSLAELDHLDLEPAAKKQVAALVQSLRDQVERDAQLLQLKEAEIQAQNADILAKFATSPNTVFAKNAATPPWLKSVKTSPNNCMSNPLSFP